MTTATSDMTLTPGIYPDVPFDEYLKINLVSQSALKQGRHSMAHLKAAMESRTEPTDEMLLGSALHVAFLEPRQLHERVVVWTGKRRAGKEWDQFQQDNAGRIILTAGRFDTLKEMLVASNRHPEIRRWRKRIEQVEVTAIGEVHGVLCRGRCDAMTDDPLGDLKKVSQNTFQRAIHNPHVWIWHCRDYGYDLQAALYMKLFNRNRFCFFFQEDKPPYEVAVVELGMNVLDAADAELEDLLTRYKQCLQTGEWPGPFPETITVDYEDTESTKVRISA